MRPLTDSRDLTYPESTIFFALRTQANDGHQYIPQLYASGVRVFVVEKGKAPAEGYYDATFFEADSVIDALQEAAADIRKHYEIPIIGITGSRGKTVLKELLYAAGPTEIARSPRSYNSQIGVPLSMWQLSHATRIGVFEAGISLPGEMTRLQKIIRPTIGVFTSLTDEHGASFLSLKEKACEKARLFAECAIVFVPAEDKNLPIILEAVKTTAPQATIREIDGNIKDMAAAVGEYLNTAYGCHLDTAKIHGLNDEITSRIDVTETLKNCLIVSDSFSSDLQSVNDALNFAHRHLTSGRTLTFIYVSPSMPIDACALASLLKAKEVSRFIGIGGALEGFSPDGIDCSHFDNADDFIANTSISDFADEVILINGAQASGADEIKSLLEAPRHETVMEVDLGAIVHNFNFFRSKIKPSTGVICMVKAAGYGVGAVELAKTLQNQGAAYLAVAVIDEGAELRRSGITMPIIAMNPIGTNYKALFDNRIEPSVFSIRELNLLLANAGKYGIKDYPIHIKLDTGMHRVGFLEEELPSLIEALAKTDAVKVASIFSHLATADCLDQDDYTQMQLDTYGRMSAYLLERLPYRPLRHVLNTAGILRYPQHQYDMVRLGIGLYGVSPIPGYKLEPVARLLSTIISLKHWGEGITIGYGRRGRIHRPSEIATVPIGYADGMNRHLGNGAAYILVNGHKCPIIGNICMDQCMADVTGADAKLGDTVEIFGANAPLQRLSEALHTIPYEILTSVSPRVKRIYFRE